MNLVYVIIVYGLLHNVQTVLPQTYPDQQSCTAALVQTHLTFGNWGSCEPLAAHAPPAVVVVPAPAKGRLTARFRPIRRDADRCRHYR